MARNLGRVGMRTLAGTLIATGPVLAACSIGPTYDQWAATDGAAGRINLDEVQNAFKKSESASDFERRVNEIYEGDGLVLIRAKREDKGLQVVEGWEDLGQPANNEIDDATDDLLFTIVQGEKEHELRGHGANGYYRQPFGGGGFLFGYMVGSAFAPRGYYYSTPRTYARDRLRPQRTRYRSTARYNSQVSRNSRHFNQQKKFAGSRYNQPKSTARQSYLGSQKSTGNFKSSGTGVRSSWGSRGRTGGLSRGSRGGFRGFGGGQVIIGAARR